MFGLPCGFMDHPRIRGEHASPALTPVTVPGSSPHPRGARVVLDGGCENSGIIPASAGSTLGLSFLLYATWDHPRIRGEHS